MTENTPHKPKGKSGSRKPKQQVDAPFDRRLMEKQMAAMARLLEEKDFATIEEANAFLQQFVASGQPLDLMSPAPETPLEQAQEIIYQAHEATGKRRLNLTRKALEVSPDCADAYVLLAEEAKTPKEALPLLEQGVAAGERSLGSEYFEELVGNFWGLIETRPYMRARQLLAQALWETGKREAAIAHAQDMLRLNPGDNQGIRYLLAGWLSITGDDAALDKLLDHYPEEDSASWAYTRLLLGCRKQAPRETLDQLFISAMETNPFVPMYLIGLMPLPEEPPDYYEMGSPDEALVYLVEAGEAWADNVEVVAWMMDALTRLAPAPHKPRATRATKPKAAKPKPKPAKAPPLDPKATTPRAKGKKS